MISDTARRRHQRRGAGQGEIGLASLLIEPPQPRESLCDETLEAGIPAHSRLLVATTDRPADIGDDVAHIDAIKLYAAGRGHVVAEIAIFLVRTVRQGNAMIPRQRFERDGITLVLLKRTLRE